MLPYLKNKDQSMSISGIIMKQRNPDKPAQEPQADDTGIEACAQDLIKAVQAGDAKAAAQAIKDAFTILEAQPHEESEEDNSFAAQNIKAAQENR